MKRSRLLTLAATVAAALALPAAAQNNGGFENGNLGSWIDLSGGTATVTSVPAVGFPSEGDFFLHMTAGTSNATPGHGPHVGGGIPGTVAMVSRTFTRPAGGNCELLIDWTFLNNEGLNEGTFNDFLSIDVLDANTNALIQNVVFIDTGTLAGVPSYTNVPGAGGGELSQVLDNGYWEQLPRGFKTARADLSGVAAGQLLRLDVSLGNSGDTGVDSAARIDNFILRVGSGNSGLASLRIMSSEHDDQSGSSSQFAEDGPYRFRTRPGQKVAFRSVANTGGLPFALLGGQGVRLGTDYGFGTLNLTISSIFIVFDGINPANVSDILLGTLDNEESYVSGLIPLGAAPGEISFQGLYADPTNFFGLGTTSATTLVVDDTVRMPVATTDVVDAGGNLLSDDDFGAVSLAGFGGGSFTFYGVAYTEVFVGSNGFLTFGSGDVDFSETVGELFTDQPRIAPMWDDFNPASIAGRVMADVSSQVARFTWRVGEYSSNPQGSHFTVELYTDGSFAFYYESLDAVDGIVGISPGGLAAPSSATSGSDLSAFSNGNRFGSGATSPRYEAFDAFLGSAQSPKSDVMTFYGARLSFAPNDIGGYDCFSGNR